MELEKALSNLEELRKNPPETYSNFDFIVGPILKEEFSGYLKDIYLNQGVMLNVQMYSSNDQYNIYAITITDGMLAFYPVY